MTSTTKADLVATHRLRRPDVAASIAFVAVILTAAFADYLSSWLPGVGGFPAGAILRDVAAVLFIALAFVVLTWESGKLRGRATVDRWTSILSPAFLPFAAFAAWVFVLLLFGPATVPALLAARNLLLYTLVGFAARLLLRDRQLSPGLLIGAITSVGFVMAALGILDTVTHGAVVSDLGYRRDYSGVEGSSGILIAGATAAFQGFVRASGGISNALVFGYLMAAISVFGTWRLDAVVARWGWGPRALVLLGLSVVTGVACVYSLTRGAMLALVVGLVLLFVMSRRWTILIGALTTLSLALVLTWAGSALLSTASPGHQSGSNDPDLIGIVGNRVTSNDPSSQESSNLRLDQVRLGMQSLVARPMGTGLGTEGSASTRQGLTGATLAPDVFALIVALQTGLVGAVLYGLTFAVLIIGSLRRQMRGRDLIVALTGVFAISSLLSASPDAPVFATIMWVLLLAISSIPDRESATDATSGAEDDRAQPVAGRATT